jgi:hypothetical protein
MPPSKTPTPRAHASRESLLSIRIAMWSGPRNISTAMMRSFENRSDTAVVDEPFYAAYLKKSGIDHPMREEVLAAYPTDWHIVVESLIGPVPDGRPIFYQKHMTHHMLDGFGRDWIKECRNAFLIRAPERVLASYTEKRPEVALADIGFVQQSELFEREANRLGYAPPVIESEDVLASPREALSVLCKALDIAFTDRMLSWPPGARASDGIWGKVWYDAVERSTGFTLQRPREPKPLAAEYQALADAARPHYERLVKHKLKVI